MTALALLRPRFLAIKNRIRSNYRRPNQLGRDIVLAAFSSGIIYAIFRGSNEAISLIQKNSQVAYLHPSLPLGMLMLMLMIMLLLSNCVSAIGTFYQGRDLDMILAAPVPIKSLFAAKMSEVIFSSSWMAMVFALPSIVAFGINYHAGAPYYLASLLILLPYFTIPAGLAVTLVTLMTRFLPVNRTREIITLFGLGVVVALYLLFRLARPSSANLSEIDELLRLVALLSLPHATWLPSQWAATSLGEILESTGKPLWAYLSVLYASALASCTLAYLSIRLLHADAYSRSRNTRQHLKLRSREAQRRFALLTPFLDQQYRALMAKEVKTFARDIAQTIQLLLLLGLCLIYLYNFRVMHIVQDLPDSSRAYWQAFLVFANVGLGAFVVTAICSRFVFPCVSMEGQSFWLLQSAPLRTFDLLRAKFWCWLVPVASMSSVIFASGAAAIDTVAQIVLVNALASWIICYGVVGLAIGLGALFANFEWENPSQLAASVGSLLFMIAASILICLSLFPVGILVTLRTFVNLGHSVSKWHWYFLVTLSAAILVCLNYCAAQWALRAGANALDARRKQ